MHKIYGNRIKLFATFKSVLMEKFIKFILYEKMCSSEILKIDPE